MYDKIEKCAFKCNTLPVLRNRKDAIDQRSFCDTIGCDDTCDCKRRNEPRDRRFTECMTNISDKLRDLNVRLNEDDQNIHLFEDTATGLLGSRRKTMLRNPLLVRHRVGAPKTCLRRKPCDNFVYGSLPVKGWTAAEALQGWTGHNLEPKIRCKKKERCANFLEMNRAAITAGITHERELRDYRNTHSSHFKIRTKEFPTTKKFHERPPALSMDSMAEFGKPTKYLSTAAEIMSYQEQRDWIKCVTECNKKKFKELTAQPDAWRENHAYSLRVCQTSTGLKPESFWHMPKFANKAKPHLSTFRSEKELLRSHEANQYEKVGRDGMFGQGIPTKAVNRADVVRCHKA